MTIDELLESARGYCNLAEREMGRDRGTLAQATQYAAIAQAFATTAQAMILRSMTFDGVDGKLALYVVTP